MTTKKLLPLLTALVMTAMGSTANANVISLTPLVQTAIVGNEVTFDIHMAFFDNTVGGAIDLFYDSSVLEFVSFDFDAAFLAGVADPDFAILPDNCLIDGAAIGGCAVGDAELNGIGFGSFDGFTGNHQIGTLTFLAIDPGVAALSITINDDPWGGFISADDASELTVLFSPAKLLVTEVPLPAGIWLLFSGLTLVAGFARRRNMG